MSHDVDRLPERDVVVEARRLLELAARLDVLLCLLGGVAIELRRTAPRPLPGREYKDIDFITRKGAAASVRSLLEQAG